MKQIRIHLFIKFAATFIWLDLVFFFLNRKQYFTLALNPQLVPSFIRLSIVRKRQMHAWMRANGRVCVLRPREQYIADASGYTACWRNEERTEGTGKRTSPVSMGAPWYAPVRFSTVNGNPRRGERLEMSSVRHRRGVQKRPFKETCTHLSQSSRYCRRARGDLKMGLSLSRLFLFPRHRHVCLRT